MPVQTTAFYATRRRMKERVMANILKAEKQLEIVKHLVNGSSIRATERCTGIHRDTICRLLVRIGTGCRELLDAEMRNLSLRHIQCDEIWTFVNKKQGDRKSTRLNSSHTVI